MLRCELIKFIMSRKFSVRERVFILQKWWLHDHNYEDVVQLFVQHFPNINPPSRQAIHNLNKRFEETGSVADLQRSGRPKSVTTEQNLTTVAQSFVQSPSKSTRRASSELGISRTSLRRMMKSVGLKPFRPTLLQGLNEDDPDRRMEFCEWYVIRQEADNNFYKSILWSDEATFKLNGRVNRHNCVYWDSENPYLVMETQLNAPGVTVWAGICAGGLIGPYMFEQTVNAENYLQMLYEVIIELENNPVFVQLRPIREKMIWQQDGAPPHYGNIVRDFLNDTFYEWIGRRGTIEWPARSPDLTPMDFSIWGILKDKVYSEKPRDLNHLKQRINSEFDKLSSNNISDIICASVLKRCYMCIENEGRHFENLI